MEECLHLSSVDGPKVLMVFRDLGVFGVFYPNALAIVLYYKNANACFCHVCIVLFLIDSFFILCQRICF